VQFMWWDYSIPRYVDVCSHLADLKKAGKIRHIGVTNFNLATLRELLDAGMPLLSNQVQYSVLDQRPAREMQQFLMQNDMSFLCYGSIAGGFLTDKYLGADEQAEYTENRSLIKYQLIIEEFGGFEMFQHLLNTLKSVAEDHDVGIAEIAARYVLQQNAVAAVIIGARNSRHLQNLQKLSTLLLDKTDMEKIRSAVDRGSNVPGDVYDIERDRQGKHGRIMNYNLNIINT